MIGWVEPNDFYGSVKYDANPSEQCCTPSFVIQSASVSGSCSISAIPDSKDMQNSAVDRASPRAESLQTMETEENPSAG